MESKRGAVAHSRVCGAADKGPSLDNYLPFARLPSVILGLETEEDRGGSGGTEILRPLPGYFVPSPLSLLSLPSSAARVPCRAANRHGEIK